MAVGLTEDYSLSKKTQQPMPVNEYSAIRIILGNFRGIMASFTIPAMLDWEEFKFSTGENDETD